MNTKLDEHLLDSASLLRDSMQEGITESNFYCKNVRKSEWPEGHGYQITYNIVPNSATRLDACGDACNLGITQHVVQLKKAAVNSPYICLDDLKYDWQIADVEKQTGRVLKSNAEWVWENAFQNAVLENCENRVLTHEPEFIFSREFSEDSVLVGSVKELERAAFWNKGKSAVKNPPRVNFWGRRVYPYITSSCTGGSKCTVNPKYKKAAEQMIVFHPDIVGFVFPDLKNWIGEIVWRNIPDQESNPCGDIGFYRMLFSYGAKPLRPELGTVITVLPPGLKGWLWYWAWKLVGFQP